MLNFACSWTSCIVSFMFYSYCLAFKWHVNVSLYVLFVEWLFIYRHDLQFINFVDSMLLLCLDPVGSVSRGPQYQGLNLLFGGLDYFWWNVSLDYFTYWTLHHCTGQLTIINNSLRLLHKLHDNGNIRFDFLSSALLNVSARIVVVCIFPFVSYFWFLWMCFF